jgi:hypothetical protein
MEQALVHGCKAEVTHFTLGLQPLIADVRYTGANFSFWLSEQVRDRCCKAT